MSITFQINEQFNGIEVKFSEKPSKSVLEKLKANGFRWHGGKGVWYAKNTKENLAFVKSIQDKNSYKQMTIFADDDETEDEVEEVVAEVVEKPINKRVKALKDAKIQKKETTTKKAEKKVEKTEEVKTEKATKKEEPSKENVIAFPKGRPNVKVAITDGNATYEQCIEKLEKERAIFCDSDSQFVISGLLKMCEINPNFRNNLMRENKTYLGAFKYFVEMAKQGYAINFEGCCYLDNNIALGFAMDYFNMVDSDVKEG